MKKLFLVLLFIAIITNCIGCKKTTETPNEVSIITPSGTPLFALGSLLTELKNIEIVNDPTLLQTALVNEQTDIVICPLTLGTNLYLNGKSKYKLHSILTVNNTYLVSTEQITDLNSLNNKTIVSFNENNTPGVITKMFLSENNINAEVIYESNVNLSTQAFLSGNTNYAVVSEPQLTQIESKKAINVIDLSSYIDSTFIPQAALFIHPEKINDSKVLKVIKQIENNIVQLYDDQTNYIEVLYNTNNPFFQTLGKDIIKKALPRCNVSFYVAKEHKSTIEEFYNYLNNSINLFKGKLPNEEFYI